jgi:WD40 repeat protein
LVTLTDESTERTSLAFVAGTTNLVFSATPGGIEIWDFDRSQQLGILPVPRAAMARVLPDGSAILTSGATGLQRWPIRRSEQTWKVGPAESIVDGPTQRFSVDRQGHKVALLRDAAVWLVDLTVPTYPARMLGSHPSVHQVTMHPDGRWFVTTAWQLGSGVRIWDCETGEEIRDLAPDMGAASAEFSPDGKSLVSGTWREYVLWEAGTWRPLLRIDRDPEEDWTGPLTFAPHGTWIATALTRHAIQVIDASTGKQIAVLKPSEPGTVAHLAFSPNGDALAAVIDDRLQVWNLEHLQRELTELGLMLPSWPAIDLKEPAPTPKSIEIQ